MPSERQTLDEQRYIFEGFVELAHLLGASPLRDGDIRIVDAGDGRRVAWFFSHGEFPGMRFGYWAKTPGEDGHEVLWLAEELATGALHRLIRGAAAPAPDAVGITWLRLHGQLLRGDL